MSSLSPCPDCGGARVRLLGALPDGVFFAGKPLAKPLPGGELLRCDTCALRWRWPQLRDYAPLYDNQCVDAWSLGPLRTDQRLVLECIAARHTARSVLDFGCYRGEFLARLPAHLARYGVEVSSAAAALAAEHAGARVVSRIDQFEAAQRFDIIVAMDVIEHVPSPRVLLVQLLQRLAPGGVLIVTTGDGGNLLFRLVGPRWWYCYFPEHLAFISQAWLQYHLPRLQAHLQVLRTFRSLEEQGGAAKRWLAWLRYLLRPAHHARKRARHLAQHGRDRGVPGGGLSRDHLLAQITR